MNEVERLNDALRAIEWLLFYGEELNDSDKTVARARLMLIVGKLRQPAVRECRDKSISPDERDNAAFQ